jgi:hypothetical protein
LIQLNNTAELVTVTIFGIGQYKLRVVLRGHGERLPRPGRGICEPQHKSPQSESESAKRRPESQTSPGLRACRVSLAARQQRPVPGKKWPKQPISGDFSPSQRKIRADAEHAPQNCCHTICNITLDLPPIARPHISRTCEDSFDGRKSRSL